jgi:exodeoxyribonuclease VIII
MIKPEFVKDTFEEYLGKKDHVSASDIKNFLKSPRYYYYERNEKVEKSTGRHFNIGSGLHELILEPQLFKTNYVVYPKVDARTKEGKQQIAEFNETSEGKTILYEDEMEMIRLISENALKNNSLVELMKDSHREVSCYTIDEQTGLKVRLRPDILSSTKSTIVDIKSCVDSSARKFKSDVFTYSYSLSAAYYCDFIGRENYIFAACSKTAPYEVALYGLNDEMYDYGREQYRMGLDLLKFCQDNNYWPSYNEFELLKECYALGSLDTYFDTLKDSQLITIL